MVLLGGVQSISGPWVGGALFTWLQDTVARQTDYWRALARRRHAGARAGLSARRRRRPEAPLHARRAGMTRSAARCSRRARPLEIVRRRSCRRRRELRARRRRDAGADRPERRRQDDLLQHGRRPARARRGLGAARRRRAGRSAARRDLAPGRRPHVPDRRDLRLADRRRERAAGAALARRPHRPRSGGRRGRQFRDEAIALLDSVGMAAQAERATSVLAYGDVKRVELAIALAHRPRLLLMDEPTAGMAPRERNELMALARRLAQRAGHRRSLHRAQHGRRLRPRRSHHRPGARRADRRRLACRRCATTRRCARCTSAAAPPSSRASGSRPSHA